MAKTNDEKLAERLNEIQKLVADKARIEARLMELTGIRVKADDKPKGFSLMEAIKKVVNSSTEPMTAAEISEAIDTETNYDPTAKNVRSTGKYMDTKGLLTYNKTTKTFARKQGQ